MCKYGNIFISWSKCTIINTQKTTHFLQENLDGEKYQLQFYTIVFFDKDKLFMVFDISGGSLRMPAGKSWLQ